MLTKCLSLWNNQRFKCLEVYATSTVFRSLVASTQVLPVCFRINRPFKVGRVFILIFPSRIDLWKFILQFFQKYLIFFDYSAFFDKIRITFEKLVEILLANQFIWILVKEAKKFEKPFFMKNIDIRLFDFFWWGFWAFLNYIVLSITFRVAKIVLWNSLKVFVA